MAAPITIQRGNRFPGDKETIALIMARSKNENLVIYETHHLGEGTDVKIDAEKPVEGYWLDIDPAYVEKARAKGKMDDREEFNFIESSMAYGVSAKPTGEVEGEFKVKFVALKDRPMTLRLAAVQIEGQEAPRVLPTMQLVLKKKKEGDEEEEVLCIMDRVYIKSKEGGWLPSVEYVDLTGYSVTTGEKITERVKP